jgi:hypothetical protein
LRTQLREKKGDEVNKKEQNVTKQMENTEEGEEER